MYFEETFEIFFASWRVELSTHTVWFPLIILSMLSWDWMRKCYLTIYTESGKGTWLCSTWKKIILCSGVHYFFAFSGFLKYIRFSVVLLKHTFCPFWWFSVFCLLCVASLVFLELFMLFKVASETPQSKFGSNIWFSDDQCSLFRKLVIC